MNKHEIISELKAAIAELQSAGETAINLTKLSNYLESKTVIAQQDLSPEQIERLKTHLQIVLESHKSDHAADLEMFKSVIQSGQNAVKTAFLMNGGASVAILAFIGKLTETNKQSIPAFAGTLSLFVTGVFLITATSGLTYLSQWLYADDSAKRQKIGFGLNLAAIFFGLASYGIFIWGMTSAYRAFLTIT